MAVWHSLFSILSLSLSLSQSVFLCVFIFCHHLQLISHHSDHVIGWLEAFFSLLMVNGFVFRIPQWNVCCHLMVIYAIDKTEFQGFVWNALMFQRTMFVLYLCLCVYECIYGPNAISTPLNYLCALIRYVVSTQLHLSRAIAFAFSFKTDYK